MDHVWWIDTMPLTPDKYNELLAGADRSLREEQDENRKLQDKYRKVKTNEERLLLRLQTLHAGGGDGGSDKEQELLSRVQSQNRELKQLRSECNATSQRNRQLLQSLEETEQEKQEIQLKLHHEQQQKKELADQVAELQSQKKELADQLAELQLQVQMLLEREARNQPQDPQLSPRAQCSGQAPTDKEVKETDQPDQSSAQALRTNTNDEPSQEEAVPESSENELGRLPTGESLGHWVEEQCVRSNEGQSRTEDDAPIERASVAGNVPLLQQSNGEPMEDSLSDSESEEGRSHTDNLFDIVSEIGESHYGPSDENESGTEDGGSEQSLAHQLQLLQQSGEPADETSAQVENRRDEHDISVDGCENEPMGGASGEGSVADTTGSRNDNSEATNDGQQTEVEQSEGTSTPPQDNNPGGEAVLPPNLNEAPLGPNDESLLGAGSIDGRENKPMGGPLGEGSMADMPVARNGNSEGTNDVQQTEVEQNKGTSTPPQDNNTGGEAVLPPNLNEAPLGPNDESLFGAGRNSGHGAKALEERKAKVVSDVLAVVRDMRDSGFDQPDHAHDVGIMMCEMLPPSDNAETVQTAESKIAALRVRLSFAGWF